MSLKDKRRTPKVETTIKVDTQAASEMGDKIAQSAAQTLQMLQETLSQQQRVIQMLTQTIEKHMAAIDASSKSLQAALNRPVKVDVKAGENKISMPKKSPSSVVVEFDDGRTATLRP